MVQRVGDNPKILAAAMTTTDARLTRLADEGRLATRREVRPLITAGVVERRYGALGAWRL